jgi:hypothetical protein
MNTTENAGWFGRMGQVLHLLRTVGADTDEDGKFLIRGTVSSFMGLGGENADVVVGADAKFLRNGLECSLPLALRGTSYGMSVTVI